MLVFGSTKDGKLGIKDNTQNNIMLPQKLQTELTFFKVASVMNERNLKYPLFTGFDPYMSSMVLS